MISKHRNSKLKQKFKEEKISFFHQRYRKQDELNDRSPFAFYGHVCCGTHYLGI